MYICIIISKSNIMEGLSLWFSQLDGIMQVFWGCAIASSTIFVIQTLLLLLGMDSSDMDVDFDGADTMDLGGGISLLTVKNFVNFFVGFGWAGISFRPLIANDFLLVLAATGIGCLFVAIFIFILKQLLKLEANGALKFEDCVGKVADVYLRIPERGTGKGKVQISINGSIHEFQAYTEGEEIPTGFKVRVVEASEGDALKVERLK